MACGCRKTASSARKAGLPVVYSVWANDMEVEQFDDLHAARLFAVENGGTVRVRSENVRK